VAGLASADIVQKLIKEMNAGLADVKLKARLPISEVMYFRVDGRCPAQGQIRT